MPLFSSSLFGSGLSARPPPVAVNDRPIPKAAGRPASRPAPKALQAGSRLQRPAPRLLRPAPKAQRAARPVSRKPKPAPASKAVRTGSGVPARPVPAPTRPPCSGAPAASSNASFWTFSVPAALRGHLDSWGLRMRHTIDEIRTAWLQSCGVSAFRRFGQVGFRLGTDCSGAEAPVWSLRALRLPFEHVFSCDSNPRVRKFIASCCPPTMSIFDDMLSRDLDAVPAVDVYVCGFPCTPYSSLRSHRTKLFKEPAAKPYFAVLKYLKHRRPALAVLENVKGLRRVIRRVLDDLEKLKWYFVFWMMIDSEDFGEPVSRPRCYFLLIRRDACISSDVSQIAEFCKRCLTGTRSPVQTHVSRRMFPNDSPEVKAWMKKTTSISARQTDTTGQKWLKKHEEFRRGLGVQGFRASGLQVVRSARQREVFSMQTQARGKDITIDVSQSIERAHARTTGVMPTITPRGVCIVGVLDRPVLPCEKLLLHGFPLHRMQIPSEITDADLASMGGNTMHLHSVGLALLMGLSLLRDHLPTALPAQCPEKVVPAQFVSISEPDRVSNGKRRRLS